jgi:hypothetical protein
MRSKAAIIAFFFARKVGSQKHRNARLHSRVVEGEKQSTGLTHRCRDPVWLGGLGIDPQKHLLADGGNPPDLGIEKGPIVRPFSRLEVLPILADADSVDVSDLPGSIRDTRCRSREGEDPFGNRARDRLANPDEPEKGNKNEPAPSFEMACGAGCVGRLRAWLQSSFFYASGR